MGPTGTGKTSYIKQHVANGIDMEKFNYSFMNFSAQTSANMTQAGAYTRSHFRST